MPRLIVGLQEITSLLGEEFISQLTYPGIYRGSPLNVTPVVVERAGRLTVVISEADSDACKALAPDVNRVVYGRYFDWHKNFSQPAATFAEAVFSLVGTETLRCDSAIPTSRYFALRAAGDIVLDAAPPHGPLHLYQKSRAEIEAQWLITRDADARNLAAFVSTLRGGDALRAALSAPPRGYQPLDRLCAEQGLDAIYVTAPHEVEMFTGLPATLIEQLGVTALFTPRSPTLLICARQPLTRADFAPAGTVATLADAVPVMNIGTLGYQHDHLAAGVYLHLRDELPLKLADAAYALRRWQDRRAADDAVYYIFAANAVLHGIDAARRFFERLAGSPLRERDLVAIYHQGVNRFARRYGFDGRVNSYFDIVHSGARTLLPATAGDYPLGSDDKTIKFDMGLRVTDALGCSRACSDIARTLCRDPEVAAIHDRLRGILINQLMPAMMPGMSGEEIHALGVEFLRPLEAELRRLGLLPADRTVDDYRRDCGHTIQRQTISAVYFLPGVKERVEEGMLGCTEYVWPVDDLLIAVEDGYLVTADGAIPFTVRGDEA